MDGFRPTGERQIHRGWRLSMVTGEFVDPSGQPFEREIVRHPGAVAVVPLHDDATVTLVRQYRPAVDRPLLEIPAGIRDVDGEKPEATAARELAEETGLRAGRVEHLVTFYNSPGFCDQETLVFLATELVEGPPSPAGTEEHWMECTRVALDDLWALMGTGQLVDGQTLLGLELARRRLDSSA